MSMSSIPKPDFTMSDLLREMAGIDQDVDLGEKLTTREFMEALGKKSMSTARRNIRPLVMKKILIPVSKTVTNMAGVETTVPAYTTHPSATWEDVERVLGLV